MAEEYELCDDPEVLKGEIRLWRNLYADHGKETIGGLMARLTKAEAANKRLISLLSRIVDDESCWYDHDGNCQAHGMVNCNGNCPVSVAKTEVIMAKYEGHTEVAITHLTDSAEIISKWLNGRCLQESAVSALITGGRTKEQAQALMTFVRDRWKQ